MNASAVILREMRTEARRPSTYWLRVAAGGLLLLAATLVMLGDIGAGATIFGGLNALLFTSIWVIVPLLTADCISRERREGTLGLLFLTPLRATSIVIAKGFVHTLRGCSYLLTALPAITIPFLLGGVAAGDLGRAALLDLSAVLLALAIGLQVSTMSSQWSRAVIAAELLSLCAALTLAAGHQRLLRFLSPSITDQWISITGFGGVWARNAPAPGAPNGLKIAAGIFGFSVAVFGLIVLFAGYRLKRSWRQEPLSKRQLWILRIFCTPLILRETFDREQARALTKNPIGWLQQYSWSARLCKWGWCLGLVLYSCIITPLADWSGNFNGWQALPQFFLIGAIAFSASGSFARERQNGALELLLVSPLTVRQITYGRLRGIIGQFIPAAGIWLLCFLFLNPIPAGIDEAASLFTLWVLTFASTGLACAFVGFYFSIRRLNFIAAWTLTLAVAALGPVLASLGALFLYAIFVTTTFESALIKPQNLFSIVLIATQAIVSWIAMRSLRRDLTRRNFGFT